MRRYEGLFLFDTNAVREWNNVVEEIQRLLARIGATLLVSVKYDERKLAYELKHRKRGTYVLAYFEAPQEKLGDLERDVQLSEVILRGLVLKATRLTEEKLAELRARPTEEPHYPMAGEGRRHDDDRRGQPRGDRHGGDYAPEYGDATLVPALDETRGGGAN